MTDAETKRQLAGDEFRRTMEAAQKDNEAARRNISDDYARTLARATKKFLESLKLEDGEEDV